MQNTTIGITLDYDFLVAMRDTGLPLYERRSTKPKFSVGDILPVRETYRYIGYNRIQHKLDSDPDDNAYWEYANTMPIYLAKRHVLVVSIEKMNKEAYGRLCQMNGHIIEPLLVCRLCICSETVGFEMIFHSLVSMVKNGSYNTNCWKIDAIAW